MHSCYYCILQEKEKKKREEKTEKYSVNIYTNKQVITSIWSHMPTNKQTPPPITNQLKFQFLEVLLHQSQINISQPSGGAYYTTAERQLNKVLN